MISGYIKNGAGKRPHGPANSPSLYIDIASEDYDISIDTPRYVRVELVVQI
tara:strand:+ start:977 stop:1129 length:153 start_codon:yes stop_codon:yes gene_type:complete